MKLRAALLVERLIAEHDPDYAAYCSSMAARFGEPDSSTTRRPTPAWTPTRTTRPPAATPPPCV
ncbi:hypothetical protein N7U49_03140 [Streptomyces sp. AD2-2]|nr:hypothetical protein N7U49_03140 [Streptomyces sp. AD2-2]